MTQYHTLFPLTLVASAELAAFAPISWAGGVPTAGITGVPTDCAGLTLHAARAGEAVAVATLGTAKALAPTAFALGDLIAVGGGGALVKATAPAAAIARALEACAAGERVEVFLLPK